MSWIYENTYINSAKNQRIRVQRLFGRQDISVDGFFQTARYTNKMWALALKRLPFDFSPKKVLLLGLGAGGILPLLKNKYGKVEITAIEWDQEMIELAKKAGVSNHLQGLRVIEEDAAEAIKNLNDRYDLIILDLFEGKKMANAIYTKDFFLALSKLSNKGYLLANVFSEPQNISLINRDFYLQSEWKYKYNTLALFRSKEAIPYQYRHYRESKEFIEREEKVLHYKLTSNAVPGVTWRLGPLRFERYLSDLEPEILPGPSRLIIWQRIRHGNNVEGWKNFITRADARRTGFVELTKQPEYWNNWSAHAKRHRLKWLENKENKSWEIYTPTSEEFLEAYKKHKMSALLRHLFIGLYKDKLKGHGDLVGIIGARQIKGPLEAAFVYVDVPEIKQSFHLISFHSELAKKNSVGVGLIDEWFKYAISKGFSYLDFCIFWAPGDPADWKGFSSFKSQFGTRFIDYPKPLFKWVRKLKNR